jgi:excisionase family DNA binding protein
VSDKNDDFLSFEKALRELKMRSEELKKLVSEGEIRAYRDGDSMKFRREDVATLHNKAEGATKLSMGDALEDDTGMVTEQISEEDTLLAEDDDVVVVEQRTTTRTRGRGAAPTVAVAAVPADREPGWVTAVAVLGFFVCLWGFALTYSISQEENPKDNVFAKPWAEK